MPIATFCAAERYAEQALRELALQVAPAAVGGARAAGEVLGESGRAELERRFFDLAEHAPDYMPVRDDVVPPVLAAREQGRTHVDVTVRLPLVCAHTSLELSALLDAAERLSSAGLLRAPHPGAEPARFRRWYLQQIHDQLDHRAAPQPFG